MSKVIKISKADMEKMLSGLHDCENCEEKECADRSKAFVKQVKPSESDLEIIKDAINSGAAYRAPVRLMGQNELFLENLKEGMEYEFHYLIHGTSHAQAHLDEIQAILARIIVRFTQIEPKLSPDGRMYVDHLVNLGIIYTNSIQDALVKLAEIDGMKQYESESSILNDSIKDISASLSFQPNKDMLASLRTPEQYVFNPDYPKDVSGYRTYMQGMIAECHLAITALQATYAAYQVSEGAQTHLKAVVEKAMVYCNSIATAISETPADFKTNPIPGENKMTTEPPSIYGTDTPAIQAIISSLVAKAEYEPNRDMLTSLLSGNGSKLIDVSVAGYDLHYLMGMFSEFRKLFSKLYKKLGKALSAENEHTDLLMKLAEAYGDSLTAGIDKLMSSGSHPDFGRNLADMIVGEKAPKATNIVEVGNHRTPYIPSPDAPTKEHHLQSLKAGYNAIVQALNKINLKHPNNVSFSNAMLENIMAAITAISPEDKMPLVAVDEREEFESLFNGIVPALDVVAHCKPASKLFQSEFHKAKDRLTRLTNAANHRSVELIKMIDACSEEELLNAAKLIENRRNKKGS